MNASPAGSPTPRSWIGPLFVSAAVVGAAAILAATVGSTIENRSAWVTESRRSLKKDADWDIEL